MKHSTTYIYCLCYCAFLLMVSKIHAVNMGGEELHGDLAATGTEIARTATSIKQILMGPVSGVVGILGFVVGIALAFIKRALTPLFIFFGIGLGTLTLPKFLDGVFSATFPF